MTNKVSETADLFRILKPYSVISLVGLSKGSGKTTVLKKLLEEYKKQKDKCALSPLAVTSIGQGSIMPEVYLYTGMLAATAEGVLKDCNFTMKICHTTGMNTPLGQVVIAEALSDGRVSLAGPVMNSQLAGICSYLSGECGAGQIIVDGAGDRKTFSAYGGNSGIVLCVGAEIGRSTEYICREARHLCTLIRLPAADMDDLGEVQDSGEKITTYKKGLNVYKVVSGALTDGVLAGAADNAGVDIGRLSIVVRDAGKIFIKPEAMERFLYRGGGLYVERQMQLAAVAANPSAFSSKAAGDSFIKLLTEYTGVPVIDVAGNDNNDESV